MEFDVIVVGGGAAGLFCARTAGLRGLRVAVLEGQKRVGNKILISGGGRCNFTNRGASAAQYVTSGSPHFIKSALSRYTSADFLALVDRHGIAWHEKKLGQLFCDRSSRDIVELLLAECRLASVQIFTECSAEGVNWTPTDGRYALSTRLGLISAPRLVVATGGLSFPQLGASRWAYQVAEQFGVRVIPPRAGLVPLTLSPDELRRFAPLSGLSVDCEASTGPTNGSPSFRENCLFTHRGLSGPAILQISSFWRPGGCIRLNLVPEVDLAAHLARARSTGREAKTILRQILPERLAAVLSATFPSDRPISQWPQRDLDTLTRTLVEWEVRPAGDEGYAKAEVTVGGIDTSELSSKTMECRRQPGLYFIGEAVDITGWLGGYNFQWAWASGHAAGESLPAAPVHSRSS